MGTRSKRGPKRSPIQVVPPPQQGGGIDSMRVLSHLRNTLADLQLDNAAKSAFIDQQAEEINQLRAMVDQLSQALPVEDEATEA